MNTRVTRRLNFSGQFKAAVALKVLRGDKMVHKNRPSGSSTQSRCARGNGKRSKAWQVFSLTKLRKLRIRTAKSKSFTPTLFSWRSKMIFWYRG
jgi:hypothetical protein